MNRRRLHIGIDLTALLPESTGVDVSLMGMTAGLAQRDRENRYTVFVNVEDRRDRFRSLPDNFRVLALCRRSRPIRLAFQQLAVPVLTAALRIDVLHSPSFTMPVMRGLTKHVLTVHDMTLFSRPDWHPPVRANGAYRRGVEVSMRRADLVVVPSLHVKRSIGQHLSDFPAESVRVIPWGVAPEFKPYGEAGQCNGFESLRLPSKYILAVGTLERRKNIEALVRAFERLKDHVREDLVLVGREGWCGQQIKRLLKSSAAAERIHYLGYAPSETLPHLYAAASVLVYPSFEEGFGFPPLEAMACGTPAVVSANSSLAENLHDSAVLVRPESDADIANAILCLLTDEATHEDYRQRGIECASRYSWSRTADQLRECYHEVASA